jgi:hypothetical protein
LEKNLKNPLTNGTKYAIIITERRKEIKTMTTIITTIIITLVAHSAIGCIIYLATKNNEEILAFWGAGILCLFTNAITAIIYGIRKITHRKYFKALLVDEEGKLYYCESKDADDIRCDRDLRFARAIVEKYTINDGWRKSDCMKSFGEKWELSARYTPIKICKAEGAEYIKIN